MLIEPDVDPQALRASVPDLLNVCRKYNCPIFDSQVDDALIALARGVHPHNAAAFLDETHLGAAAVAIELGKVYDQQPPAAVPETLALLAFALPVFDLLESLEADPEFSAVVLAAAAALLRGEPLASSLVQVGDHPHAQEVRAALFGLPDGATFMTWLSQRQAILRRHAQLQPLNPELDDPRPLARVFNETFWGRPGWQSVQAHLPTTDAWVELW